MQVERRVNSLLWALSGGRVSNTWATYLKVEDSPGKLGLILHVHICKGAFGAALRWARGLSASWWGNGSPRRRRVAGLRGWSVTLELRHGPDTYGWQQSRIIHNGRKSDGATPRGGWRFSDCKLLSSGSKTYALIEYKFESTRRGRDG